MSSEIDQKSFHLFFKEQYWCVSTATGASSQELAETIKKLGTYAQDRINTMSEKDLNPSFVPDQNDRNRILKIAQNIKITSKWEDFLENFNYSVGGKEYTKLGYILFRIELKDEQTSTVDKTHIRPNDLQQIVFRLWFGMIKEFADVFKFDDLTPPYVVSVCSGHSAGNGNIPWNQANIMGHKEELSAWIEIFSGQFPDYNEELYNNRVHGNLSNRMSEMHFIKNNSSLIYMEPENYNLYFIKDENTPKSTGYMHSFVVSTIARVRTIAFAMIIVNSEIDEDTRWLGMADIEAQKPGKIKAELEKTNKLKLALQRMVAPFFTDLTRSHRPHYRAILQECVQLNQIQENWQNILAKIDSNTRDLNAIFLDKQEESSERQESILNMVNMILGAGILFEIFDFIFGDVSWKPWFGVGLGGAVLLIVGGLLIKLGLKKKK